MRTLGDVQLAADQADLLVRVAGGPVAPADIAMAGVPRSSIISAGCAIQNMLLTAHALGFGAGLSSGRALYSQRMKALFGLGAHEQPLCFMSVGTVQRRKPARPRPVMAGYTSTL